MLIVGLKVTHDGGVALVDGDRLVFSIEVEKLANRTRYSELGDLELVDEVLRSQGRKLNDVDLFVVDGWGYGEVSTTTGTTPVRVPVAPYREPELDSDSLAPYPYSGLQLAAGKEFEYRSFHHTTGHTASAYCASPFAEAAAESFVLVWDGGVVPRCYYVRPEPPFIENLGPVFGLLGNAYAVFAMHFPPFQTDDPFLMEAGGGADERIAYNERRLSVPGKVMAYTALGEVREDLCREFDRLYGLRDPFGANPRPFTRHFVERSVEWARGRSVRPADALASFQHWLGGRLVDGLRRTRERISAGAGNLCFAGGCALNIKWNAAIRRSGVFDRFWVPPFPNDSGSAVGAACAGMMSATGRSRLRWSAYSGPDLGVAEVAGYRGAACDVRSLAGLLHRTGEPVVVLHGRAELGPRALGNRSILAPATDPAMKDRLNRMKGREEYRPVSPICLAHRAPEIFDPGTPDPYMLFDHDTRPEWISRIPAVVHLDGTARLQTVDAAQNGVIAALLTEYEELSGVPVLCNTSANLGGRGFFPDVASALNWGRARYVWSDGVLWEREPQPADPCGSPRNVEARS